jgi:hypothetical protein
MEWLEMLACLGLNIQEEVFVVGVVGIDGNERWLYPHSISSFSNMHYMLTNHRFCFFLSTFSQPLSSSSS